MNFLTNVLTPVVCATLLTSVLVAPASAQKSKKYRSPFTADETYKNIVFHYTRVKDPGAGQDYFQYGYKNNSNKKLRISFSISGAGLVSSHTGSVVVGPKATKGGGSRGMFLNGNRGGHLTSRITNLAEVSKRQNSIYSDFENLEKELSPKGKRELSNKEISRILQDHRTKISNRADHHAKVIANLKQKASPPLANPSVKKTETAPSGNNSISTSSLSVGEDGFIDSGGGRIYIKSDGTASKFSNTGAWSYSGNKLRYKLTSSSGRMEEAYEGTLTSDEPYNGQPRLTFSGTKTHTDNKLGGTSTRKKVAILWPDGN